MEKTVKTKVFDPWTKDRNGDSREVMVNDTKLPDTGYGPCVTRAKTLTFHLDYPLSDAAHSVCPDFQFKRTRQNGWTWNDMITTIRRIYNHIYNHADKYGVWGHGIDDLVIEDVEYKDGHVRTSIGS